MDYAQHVYGVQPTYVTHDGENMVMINEEAYQNMVLDYHDLKLREALQRAKERRARGETKYYTLAEVSQKLKAKHGF